jgi:tetratricopeptide (TPR) repeat protein
MSIGDTLSRLLLKRLVDDVFRTGGAEALDAVVDFLTRCGQLDDARLTAALESAMHRAWRAVEVALTDELSWDHSQVGFAPPDAQALRSCLRRVAAELACGGGRSGPRGVANALRRQCLGELRLARQAGTLAGCLNLDEWARSQEVFARFAADQERPYTRRRTEGQLLRDLEEQGCVGLVRVLTGASGLPLLLMAARAFACQELAQLLYSCLQDNPEQTPSDCSLVLQILNELSRPRFSVWRKPLPQPQPVHWSRLDSGPPVRRAARMRKRWNQPLPYGRFSAPNRGQGAGRLPFSSWTLPAVLTVAVFLLGVVPLWLLAEDGRQHRREEQQQVAQQQRLRLKQQRLEEERQQQIDAQRRLAWEQELRRRALQRQEQEQRRRAEAEKARRQVEQRAVQRRAEERRREEERQARLREEQQRRERARTALEEGLRQAALRQDRQALAALSEAVKLDPNLTAAWKARGVVRRRLGALNGALSDFHCVVNRDPKDADAWFQCGELHVERGEEDSGIEAFSAVLRLQPRNAEAYRQRGLCRDRAGQRDDALADLAKAIELDPDNPWTYYHRANLYRQNNDIDRAFKDYTAAIDRDRSREMNLAGAYRERGAIYLHLRLYEKAIDDLTSALDRDSEDTAALRARCRADVANSDWNDAIRDAERLLKSDPEDGEAYKLRGQAYLAQRKYRRADDDFSRSLRLHRDAETFYLRARTKVQLGAINAAIWDCNDATAINPRLACAYYLRGNLYVHEGLRFSGQEDRRRAHQLDPQYPYP